MSIGLREYARHRKAAGLSGGTLRAVQVAIRDGRLSKSLTVDGKIRSVEAADREWDSTTHTDRVPISGPTASGESPPDLQGARARRELALAQIAEVQLAELLEEMGPYSEMRAYMEKTFTVVRTQLLALPSKLKQRDHSFTIAQITLVDDLIRETLTELADDDDGPSEDGA